MYYKLALTNVKKSFKDYSIYFLTLTLSVCIFYSFNSIGSQKALFELNQSTSESIQMMMQLISIISVFVSFILGSLIVYANNFLIKKRKKELGIYMSLGMSKNKISKILITETFIVGIVSLISGLLLGIVASQGLSVFTAKLFEVPMTEYNFVLSTEAVGKTILYFGIMFVLVMIFNTVIISKYKIIDLLTSSRKNENIRIKNPYIYILSFILSLILIGLAYYLVEQVGFDIQNIKFKISIVLGVIGTFIFFFSLAGFALNVIRKSKNLYFKDLNIFILNQINSKINTNFISMSVICLMLFMTIGVLSTGLSFKDALQESLEDTTPFDVSGNMYISEDDKIKSIEESLDNLGFKFDNNEKYAYINEYRLDENMYNSLEAYTNSKDKKELKTIGKYSLYLSKLSEYNNTRELLNKESLELKENEVFITSNQGPIVDLMNKILKYNNKINIDGKEYTIKNKKVITDSMRTTGFGDNMFTIIMQDNQLGNAKLSVNYININYDEKYKDKSEKKYVDLFKSFRNGKVDFDKSGFIIGYTKDQTYAENKGMTTTVLFVGIYLGIVFLISSMAVLALQQLSEASDSIDRYKSLKRIGANEKMINRSIFIQTLIYFTLPLILAFVHALVGIDVVNEFIKMFGNPDIMGSSIMTVVIFVVVYAGYFYATYTGYKNIVKNS